MLINLKIKYLWLSLSVLVSAVLLPSMSKLWAQDLIEGQAVAGSYQDDDWDAAEEPLVVSDPLESYNRAIMKINNVIFDIFLRPLSIVYSFVIPKKVQKGIDNVFSNAIMPVRFANNLFQKKFKRSSSEVGRFVINTTFGIGGLFDPAESAFNLEQYNEDFGQTLGYYGKGSGPYIIWPVLGPSNGRDSIGFAVDFVLNPLNWLSILNTNSQDFYLGLSALNTVNNYSYNVRDNYDKIMKEAIDPYISLRDGYTQNRIKKISE